MGVVTVGIAAKQRLCQGKAEPRRWPWVNQPRRECPAENPGSFVRDSVITAREALGVCGRDCGDNRGPHRAHAVPLCIYFLALPAASVSEQEGFEPRTGLAPSRGHLLVDESQVGPPAFTCIPGHLHGLEIKIDDVHVQCCLCIKGDTEMQS